MKCDAFVLDTNVLISAALSAESAPAKVTLWVIAHARLIFAEPTFDEFRTRLWRPKFDRYLTIERRNQILDRKSVVSGKSVSVRVDLGGRRIIKINRRQYHAAHVYQPHIAHQCSDQ